MADEPWKLYQKKSEPTDAPWLLYAADKPEDQQITPVEVKASLTAAPMRWNDRLAEGLGSFMDPLMRMGTSMISKPVSDAAGLAAIPLHAAGLSSMSPTEIQRAVQEAMTYQPRTQLGASESNPLNYIPNAIGNAASKGLDYIGLSQAEDPLSISGMLQNAGREAIPQALAIAGVRYGPAAAASMERGMQSGARNLMTSALKPVIKAHRDGSASTAVTNMLDRGINVSPGGVQTVRDMLDTLDDNILRRLDNSTARVDLGDAIRHVPGVMDDFYWTGKRPENMAAIRGARNEITSLPEWRYNRSTGVVDIPVQEAQLLKQGIYRDLRKKYGTLGAADVEAQKAIARGLRESVARVEPTIGDLVSEQAQLIPTLQVLQRRVDMAGNHNPIGLAASIAAAVKNPSAAIGAYANSSSFIKSLLARGMNASARNVSRGIAYPPAAALSTLGFLQQNAEDLTGRSPLRREPRE